MTEHVGMEDRFAGLERRVDRIDREHSSLLGTVVMKIEIESIFERLAALESAPRPPAAAPPTAAVVEAPAPPPPAAVGTGDEHAQLLCDAIDLFAQAHATGHLPIERAAQLKLRANELAARESEAAR